MKTAAKEYIYKTPKNICLVIEWTDLTREYNAFQLFRRSLHFGYITFFSQNRKKNGYRCLRSFLLLYNICNRNNVGAVPAGGLSLNMIYKQDLIFEKKRRRKVKFFTNLNLFTLKIGGASINIKDSMG